MNNKRTKRNKNNGMENQTRDKRMQKKKKLEM